jgi:hypothetical protein
MKYKAVMQISKKRVITERHLKKIANINTNILNFLNKKNKPIV